MFVCVCVHMCPRMCVWTSVSGCVEVRGQYWKLSSIVPHITLLFVAEFLTFAGALWFG